MKKKRYCACIALLQSGNTRLILNSPLAVTRDEFLKTLKMVVSPMCCSLLANYPRASGGLFSKRLKQILLTAGEGRFGVHAVFVNTAEIGDIPGGFFSGAEKAAVSEAMTERQAGPDQKGRGVLFFDMRGDQNRFMTTKRKPR
jgi:hypothetical protein